MTRAPPYLRAQSSPTLPPHSLTPSPTSSTFIGAPLRPRPQMESIAARLFKEQWIPVFVVDERMAVREMNRSAKRVFGIEGPSAGGENGFMGGGRKEKEKEEMEMIKVDLLVNGHHSSGGGGGGNDGGATLFFATERGLGMQQEQEQVKLELRRLVDLCSAREKRGSWGEGEKTVLLKNGRPWEAEVIVRKFSTGSRSDEDDDLPHWIDQSPTSTSKVGGGSDWYEVVLLRPWEDRVAELPPVSGPFKTQEVLDSVPHVRSDISAASLPNPHIAAPDVDPSVLPSLVPSAHSSTTSHTSEIPESPMRRKDSYYSDRTPTLGSSYTSGNLFSNTWSMNPQRSTSTSSKTATPSGGSWEYAKPFGSTIEEDESATVSPQAKSPGVPSPPSDLQERRSQELGIRGQDHYDPSNPPPPASSQLRLPSSAIQRANSDPLKSGQPRSDGTEDPSSSTSSGNSALSFDQSSKSFSTAATSVPSQAGASSAPASNCGESPPTSGGGGAKPRFSPTTAAALRPGGPSPVLPERLQGMGISVSSAGIQLSQSTPLEPPRSRSTPVTTADSTSTSTPTPVALHSPSLITPTSSAPLPFSSIHNPSLAPRFPRPHPLSLSRSNLSDSSNTSASSHESIAPFPLGSPRPTALPPLPPKPPNSKPDTTSLLQFSALANLPKTGVIIADPEISSGYVNALARELLMGVPAVDQATPNSPMSDDLPEDWWNFGHWSVEDEPWSSVSGASGSVHSSSSGPFFTGANASPSASDRSNPYEAKDLMYQAIIAAGEAVEVEKGKGTAGTGLRIGKPIESNRWRTTVAGILARSLVGNEKRKTALRGEKNKNTPPPTTTTTSNLGEKEKNGIKSPGGQSTGSGSGSSRTSSSTQVPGFIAAGGVGAQGRKPYKVFDQSFSQRVIDPFEPLLEMVARRGEQPPTMDEDDDDEYDQATNGMIVGIEVEVWEAAAASKSAASTSDIKNDSFVTANVPAMQLRKQRVRRRIIEVTAAPLFAPTKQGVRQHLGGVLLLRDITDDQRRMGQREPSHSQLQKKKGKGSGETYFKQASFPLSP